MKNCFVDNKESMLDPDLLKTMCDYMMKTVVGKLKGRVFTIFKILIFKERGDPQDNLG